MAGLKSLRKTRRIQVLAGSAVALAVAAGLIGFGFRDGINLYRSPSQLAEAVPAPDEYFQLGGLVKEESITNRHGVTFDFVITDGAAEVPVSYVGRDPAPDLFHEGQGTIAKGYYREGVFQADNLLAKHDETYMPREVIDTLKDTGVYREPEV